MAIYISSRFLVSKGRIGTQLPSKVPASLEYGLQAYNYNIKDTRRVVGGNQGLVNVMKFLNYAFSKKLIW